MQLLLTGKNFVISDRVRDYVDKKIGKLDRYLPEISEARVEITQEKTKNAQDKNIVQVTLRTNGTILRAEERANAIYACIDAVSDKIHRQIDRFKGKRKKRRHGHPRLQYAEGLVPALEDEVLVDELIEEDDDKRQIVRVKRFPVNSMTEDEAIEQMELLGHDFFVFFNGNLGRMNVLYRRADNDYGLLDPELV